MGKDKLKFNNTSSQDQKKYYQVIPEKINLALPEIESLIKPAVSGYSTNKLKEVISIVACHVRKDEASTPLSIEYIRKLVPKGEKYLLSLIDLGIIQRSGQYVPGECCYQYNFAPEYNSRFLSFPLIDPKLIRRIRGTWDLIRKESAKQIRSHSDQVIYLKQLTIADEYYSFLKSEYKTDTNQFNSIVGSATRIINGDIFYSIDNTSGRFHSNVTNICKGLRQFLRIKNEPLVNIDIKNSQPYLSTIILTYPAKVADMAKNTAFALLLKTLQVSVNKEDVKKYILLVNSGQLYEYLMQEFTVEGLELTRDETKIQVLRILFARNRLPADPVNRYCRLIFKDRFPTVHRIFSKVRGSAKGDKFTNFKRFAVLMQTIESYLMLDIILKRIYKELPGTIAITIHDSIMTGILTNRVEEVKKIMFDELQYFVGLAPKLTVESGRITENKLTFEKNFRRAISIEKIRPNFNFKN